VGKPEYRGKVRSVKYCVRFSCWISPCYGSFSLGVRFDSYELFISLIFNFVFRLQYTADTESTDMEAHLYLFHPLSIIPPILHTHSNSFVTDTTECSQITH
jgi:hypothetical protein